MKRLPCGLAALFVLVGLAMPARADLTLTARSGATGLGTSADSETVTYLKGLRMRSDVTVRGQRFTTIIDLDAERFIAIDHRKGEAEVFDLRQVAADVQKLVEPAVNVSLTATGRQRTILGQTCDERLLAVTVAMTAGGGERVELLMRGPVWIAPGSPGRADYAAFYDAVAAKGLFFVDPRAARADPARARGLTALYRRLADQGVAYATEIEIHLEGGGDAAAAARRAGSTVLRTEIGSISTEPLSDELFGVPAGYVTKAR